MAALENDPDGRHLRILIRELAVLSGIEVLQVDRVIATEGSAKPQDAIMRGHDVARGYLREIGASAMVWGVVLDNEIPRLYWTMVEKGACEHCGATYRSVDATLPDLFWRDLADVLRLLAICAFPSPDDASPASAARAEPLLQKMRNLVAESQAVPGWSQEDRFALHLLLANALATLAEQSRTPAHSLEAIELYRRLLETDDTTKTTTGQRASVEISLGAILVGLGEDTQGDASLEEAHATYQSALAFYETTSDAVTTARVRGSMAYIQSLLGMKRGDAQTLRGSADTFRSVLPIVGMEAGEGVRAALLNALGATLLALDQLSPDANGSGEPVIEALRALDEAATHTNAEASPSQWAMIQNNIGIGRYRVGSRERSVVQLEAAQKALEGALQVRDRNRSPIETASSTSMLGLVISALAESGPPYDALRGLRHATELHSESLRVLNRDAQPLLWADSQYNLGGALFRLALRENDPEGLYRSAVAFGEALGVYMEKGPEYKQKAAAQRLSQAMMAMSVAQQR